MAKKNHHFFEVKRGKQSQGWLPGRNIESGYPVIAVKRIWVRMDSGVGMVSYLL